MNDSPTVARRPNLDADGTPPGDRPAIAGYDLVRELGRGGMGVVWEAIEHRFDRRVAVKVHAAGLRDGADQSELWAEALVAARIGDPSIVRVLDVGYTLAEQPYYAMELVEGSDLHVVLADGPLAPKRALDIAADVARAAAAAHEHGVIHRDLKPRNVIIDPTGRARVVDFGIALDMREHDRFEGAAAGSPSYMAPEQVCAEKITPQTDIWAIGVVLYQMLTGARPFRAPTTSELLLSIVEDEPAPPSELNPKVHADLDHVVMRCLAKSPAARYASARSLFETLHALAEGRPVEAPPSVRRLSGTMRKVTPSDRPKREDAKKHLSWTFHLRSSAPALWPYVANTDRFNRAIGLSPVNFTDEPPPPSAPSAGALRTGEMRVMGMTLKWREYPFEWIKDREHSVFRWYSSGPVSAIWNKVTLTPRPDGGCELSHDIWMTPRGVIGQVAAFVEGTKLGPSIEKFYRHLDDVIVAGGHVDPFEPPHDPTPETRAALERACARLHEDGFSANIVEKLAMYLLTAPDGALRTMRPFELADAWGLPREEVFDTMIHAAHVGLLEPAWDVVCPLCQLAHESVPELAQVKRVGTCKACAKSFERDLRESVELVFTPSPSLRRVQSLTYCAGAPALRPHVLVQQVLDPGETRRVTVDLPRGVYRVAASSMTTPSELVASAVGFEPGAEAIVESARVVVRPAIVQAGAVTFELKNESGREETVRVEVPGARVDGVSASTAMTHPKFREHFTSQLLARGELLPVSQLSFVFVEVRDKGALFEALDDAAACAELTRLDEIVRETAEEHEGTLVPSSLDLLVVAFPTPVLALRAGLEIQRRVEESRLRAPVAMAAHDGRCIALTRDGKPEFFGETLHRGQSLLEACDAGELALSASFAADRLVAMVLHDAPGAKVSVETSQSGPYKGRRIYMVRSVRTNT